MYINDCLKLLKPLLQDDILSYNIKGDNLYIEIPERSALRNFAILQSNAKLKFCSLTDCFALRSDDKFLIYFQLHSYKLDITIFVFFNVNHIEKCVSISPLFHNANFYEDEISRNYNIQFASIPQHTLIQ